MPQNVHVDVPIVYSRHYPVAAAIEAAKAIRASGVADSLCIWDQMTFFAPPRLWNPANSPLAEVLPDIDSFPDPYIILAQIAAAVPGFPLTTTSDAVRRGPAEITQSLLTLGDVSGATVMCQMGAGELKQCKPFGHKRSQGIKRLEDTFEIFRKFMDNMGPISHEGNHWHLDQAWLGGARPPHKPQLWALGGGPRLIEAATKYGDGFCTAAPFVWSSPEQTADKIAEMRQKVSSHGRDPDDFGYGIWWITLMHEDRAVIEEAMANDYIKWVSTVMGRFNNDDWRAEGIEPPLGEDWFYASKMTPISYDEAFTADVLSRSTPEIVEKSWYLGSPAEQAQQIKPYIEAGVNFVQIIDFCPLTRPASEAAEGLGRSLELARLIKAL